jgi:RNA polymerase sigma factor for flagellar operon FliA
METGVKEVELRDLWRRYKDDGDGTARERLVVAYSPMVKFVAGRLGAGLPSHVEDADLISYGLVGLIGAIERFEPERGIKFETFAMTRIRGSIIDELRSLDWVPRSVRSRAREIETAQTKLEHELQRAPSESELAAKLNMSEEELQSSLLEIATIADDGASDPQVALDSSEVKDRLTEAIGSLPEREQLVVALYYYENLTLREIGEVLGVTESRVSQLHTKAVMRLKSHLQQA